MRRQGFILLGLGLLTLAVYAPALWNDFVDYDDPDYVTANLRVQQGLSAEGARWAFTTTHASNWHPLTWLSHMADCQCYHLRPAGHHATSVLLHTANTLLIFSVLTLMTGAVWRSAVVAAIFGLHPLHVESVAWVAERKDVLSAFFWILALGAYTLYTRDSGRRTGRAIAWYLAALGLFALGLLSKPMVVTLPFALLLADYWPLKRIGGRRDGRKAKARAGADVNQTVAWGRLVLEKAPFLLLAVASCAATFYAQQKGGAISPMTVLPLGPRFANAVVSFVRYAAALLWPANLAVLYPFPTHWPVWMVIACGVILVGISALVIRVAARAPFLAVGWFWFLGTLVPVIGLVQVGIQAMADRYMYLPSVGLFIMVVWGLAEWLANHPRFYGAARVATVCALAACAGLTVRQITYWRNSGTLFRRAIEVTRDNYLAYNNLGYYLYAEGKSDEAMVCYERCLAINPNYAEAENNVGFSLLARQRNAEAIPHFEAALRLKPALPEAHNNLGNALSNLGRLDDAIEHYRIALRLDPEHVDAHNNLGIALAMQGKLEEAISELRTALRMKPADAGAHGNLGNALAAGRQFDEAAREYHIALQLNPADFRSENNLGNILSEQGRLDEAISHYRRALKLDPDNSETHCNLGVVLARQGKRDEALREFQEALRLRPDYPEARRRLAELSALR